MKRIRTHVGVQTVSYTVVQGHFSPRRRSARRDRVRACALLSGTPARREVRRSMDGMATRSVRITS